MKPGQPKTARLLSPQSASAELGVPVSSLRDCINRGELPIVRLGSSRRVWLRREDLESFIKRSVEVRQ